MNARTMVRTVLTAALLYAASGQSLYANHTLVGDPFITSYEGWIDPAPDRGGNWRLNLLSNTIMETSDLIPAGGSSSDAANNDNGNYVPTIVVQDGFTTPSDYEFDARLYTNDDDLFGLVFGYQDIENYFRVGMRNQSPGNFGGTTGLSVQKVSGGVVTQISPNGQGPGPVAITQMMIDDRELLDVKVVVAGTDYEVFLNGNSLAVGSDDSLAAGKIGIQSWAQRTDTTATLYWGTEAETISVSDDTGILYSGTFGNKPVQWRNLAMANSDGVRTDQRADPTIGDDIGNFGLDIDNGWIYQQTNGFEWATATAPHADFIGPAVVVDEPGNADFKDYEMRVRLGARDDDGLGVLVRVQDDDNFYRINFTNEAIDDGDLRAPRGMSIQKVQDGAWSEIFRDDQDNPLFVHLNGSGDPASGLPMFDLRVRVVGDTFNIQVIDHEGNVFDYDPIVDNNDPLLTGTVGLTTWGNEHVYYMGYGGGDGPLLTHIPEPSSVALALLAGLGLWGLRRRRA